MEEGVEEGEDHITDHRSWFDPGSLIRLSQLSYASSHRSLAALLYQISDCVLAQGSKTVFNLNEHFEPGTNCQLDHAVIGACR